MPKPTVSLLRLLAVAFVPTPLVGAILLFPKDHPAGRASVLDGNIIEIHDQQSKLEGIDAPESRQTCNDTKGKSWRCGKAAALALADKIG